MAGEGLITERKRSSRIDPASLDQLLHPTIDPHAARDIIATGLPASPGAATGEIVFTATRPKRPEAQGRKVILVRLETSPEDIHGMHAAEGILTTRGGMTSHAAVVARGMGKPCVSGAGCASTRELWNAVHRHGATLKSGDVITIDGSTGQVLQGRNVAMHQPELSGDFGRSWSGPTRCAS
jgi:pyruvate,orthophosphate dikinase